MRQPWTTQDDSQRALLNNAGIMEADWQNIVNVPRQKLHGNDIHDVSDVSSLGLSEDESMRLQARMMGFVRMGGDIVTSEHNITAQTIMSAGGRTNALTKQVMLFKNAGAIQTARMLDRLSRKSGGTRVSYVAATAAMSLGFGYMALAAQALTNGQKPLPINDWRTIGRAMAVAGGFATVQDLITSMYGAVSGDNIGRSCSAVPIFDDLATLGKITFTAPTDPNKGWVYGNRVWPAADRPPELLVHKGGSRLPVFQRCNGSIESRFSAQASQISKPEGEHYFYDSPGSLKAPQIGQYTRPIN